jgi:hypothetical protein
MRSAIVAALSLAALAGCAGPISFPEPDAGDAGTELTCLPNLDGQIAADELQPALNLPVDYVVSPPGVTRTVNVAGTTDSAGDHAWDFSQSFANDVSVTIAASALNGKWYQASFPGGQWAAPVDVGDTIEGVYSADSQAIYLLGVASTQEAPADGQTLIVYGSPVALYRFPLAPGSAWTSAGTVQGGMLHGLAYAGTDTYAVTDDAIGELTLHDYVFTQVHRVRLTTTLSPSAGETQVTRQVSFMFECFGEIVRATSEPGETNDDFTTAAEVRRFNGP